MAPDIRCVILAQPGRSRDSLVALLRTLRPAGLFPIDPADVLRDAASDNQAWLSEAAPSVSVIILDLAGVGPSGGRLLALARERWPGARCLALVETLRLTGGVAQGADCILHRSASAGELLAAVQRLAVRGDRVAERRVYSHP